MLITPEHIWDENKIVEVAVNIAEPPYLSGRIGYGIVVVDKKRVATYGGLGSEDPVDTYAEGISRALRYVSDSNKAVILYVDDKVVNINTINQSAFGGKHKDSIAEDIGLCGKFICNGASAIIGWMGWPAMSACASIAKTYENDSDIFYEQKYPL